MKKIILLIFSIFMIFTLNVKAAERYIVTEPGILSSSEINDLENRFQKYSQEYEVDFVYHIVDRPISSIDSYISDFIEINRYGSENGNLIIFIVNLDERDWYIHTRSLGDNIVDDRTFNKIENQVIPNLTSADYYDAAGVLLTIITERTISLLNPLPFYQSPEFYKYLLFALIIALLIAAIFIVYNIKSLKNVRINTDASKYIEKDSVKVLRSEDLYLYSNTVVVKIPKPQNRSSGGSRGGGITRGGKF